MTRDAGITSLSSSQDLVDSTHKFRASESYDIIVDITVGSDRMIDVQFILKKMFMDSVYGIQRGFLTWDPGDDGSPGPSD
jgi:hypothetical protein